MQLIGCWCDQFGQGSEWRTLFVPPAEARGDATEKTRSQWDGETVRDVTITVSPDERFCVPASSGYSVYAALLAALQAVDADVSQQVHDQPFGSLHNSGLLGDRFGESDRHHQRVIYPDAEYTISLGLVDPADAEVLSTLVEALVFEEGAIELTNGTLSVERFESKETTRDEVLAEAASYGDPTITVEFQTPTCIIESGEVTTMFPHRRSVFRSLANRWQRTLPADSEVPRLDPTVETIESSVIEKPELDTLDTHSVLVNRYEDDEGETHPEARQGFSGLCAYEFKKADRSLQNAIVALARFGEFGGVGSAVARGCGSITVDIEE